MTKTEEIFVYNDHDHKVDAVDFVNDPALFEELIALCDESGDNELTFCEVWECMIRQE
jgi:hypothetical protein